MYPSFKLHKQSEEKIKNKETPPARFVNNSKFGPLYRLEKWLAPYMTKISRSYCAEEFLLDTDDLLNQINVYNNEVSKTPKQLRKKVYLCSLDVTALYPSIRPNEAMAALKCAFTKDETTPTHTKEAILEFCQLILDNSYIKYEDQCFKSLIGIPTGGCNSRQTADCLLHYMFDTIKGEISLWKFIIMFKRFIDDIFCIWQGTIRQFEQLIEKLNKLSAPFGIHFGEYSIGSEVNFLDVTLKIDDNGLIQYSLYKKPTDSRLYLKTGSFHPRHVFDSVAYSQLLRVSKRNSGDSEEDTNDL